MTRLLVTLPLIMTAFIGTSPVKNTKLPPITQKAGNDYIYKDINTRSLEKMVTPWLLYYTNLYRTEHGLDTLKHDNCLLTASGYHSEYLFNESNAAGQFKLVHQEEPASKWFMGASPSDRALKAGCKKYCGENALFFTRPSLGMPDFTDPAKLNATAKAIARNMVYEQWDHSKPHKANMLLKDYTCFGVAVAIGKNSAKDGSDIMPGSLVIFGVQVFAY